MQLTDFECPNCGAADMVTTEDEKLRCAYCGSIFGEAARVCTRCGHYNDEAARHCSVCGAQVLRDCPACGWDNWVLADHCIQCGRNLDLIDQMARRLELDTRAMQERRRGDIAALKAEEERASQQRMSVFLEAERQRQEDLARARAARQARDRQMFALLGAAIVFFVVIAVLLMLLLPGGG